MHKQYVVILTFHVSDRYIYKGEIITFYSNLQDPGSFNKPYAFIVGNVLYYLSENQFRNYLRPILCYTQVWREVNG